MDAFAELNQKRCVAVARAQIDVILVPQRPAAQGGARLLEVDFGLEGAVLITHRYYL